MPLQSLLVILCNKWLSKSMSWDAKTNPTKFNLICNHIFFSPVFVEFLFDRFIVTQTNLH